MVEEKERRFKVAGEYPAKISNEEASLRIIKAIQAMQAVERNYIGRDEAVIAVEHSRPIRVMTVADLHMGSIATDYDAIMSLRDSILKDPDACIILLGDEIEGLTQKYLDTNAARTIPDVHQQIDMVKTTFIRPLAEQGKILGMVSGYFGHNGWTQDQSTVNTWMMMADEFGIPVIRNGGLLKIRYASGQEQSIEIHHNPPGKSKYDPVYGLREAIQSISEPNRPNMATAGHTHRAGIAKEYQPAVNNGKAKAQMYINTGAFKGSNAQLPPDRFGVKLGFPLADKPGQGFITYFKGSDEKAEIDSWPALTTDVLLTMQRALELLNDTESAGTTAEYMGMIRDQITPASARFNERGSRKVATPFDESPEESPQIDETYQELYGDIVTGQYQTASWNIVSDLPVSIDFIQNIREGSHASGYDALERYMAERFAENPQAFIVFLRNIVDQDVADDPKRKAILDKLVSLGVKYPEQVLAVLHDSNLRSKSWKKSVGKSDDDGPIPAGSYLANGMGAKLIRHKSTLRLAVGPSSSTTQKPVYSVMTLDKQGRHGSSNRPTFGNMRIYDRQATRKPGVVAGGHLGMSGFSSRFDGSNPETDSPVFIAPGWWADTVDTEGKGNSGPGALPGQAAILIPGKSERDYMVIPTSNPEETKLFHEALILWYGLQILGLIDKAKKL